jgi:hypothetical protein
MNRKKCLKFLQPHLENLIYENNRAVANCITDDTTMYFNEQLKIIIEVQKYLGENLS